MGPVAFFPMPLPFPSPAFPSRPPRGPLWLALGVLAVGLAATLLAWNGARLRRIEGDRGRLARFVGRTEWGLRNRLGRYEDILRGAQGILALDRDDPTPEEWKAYVDRLDLPGRHPGLASLAFVRPIPERGVEAFLRARPRLKGRLGRPVADPLPPGEAALDGGRFVIELCEPRSDGDMAPGLELSASRSQRMAAERARDSGNAVLSGLLYFSPEAGRKEAVTLFLPVYAGMDAPTTPAERRQRLRGWVSAGILLRPLVDDLLRGEDGALAFEIVDTFPAAGPRRLATGGEWPEGTAPSQIRTLDAGGRAWQLRYAIRPGFYHTEGRNQPLLILVGGLILTFSLTTMVWSLAGTRVRALGLAQGMNASLSEALQRTRSHMAFTPLAVIETDAAFRIREWNPAAKRIFGYGREAALGRDPRFLVPPELQSEVAARREALLTGAAGLRLTMENVTRTGQRILCDWYNTALRDGDGRLLGAIFMADDITERRRAESVLQQTQKLESLGVLAGGIAHDFNNLLTAILGNTEMALEFARGHLDLQAALHRIESTTQRGSDLARQLLAYAGKAHFAVKPLDLNAVIAEMGDLLAVSISKKVTLLRDLQPGLPPVEADAAQFQQVVMNLVINASEAIGDRPGTVTVRTRAEEWAAWRLAAEFPGQVLEPGLFVRMEVEDDGAGMDAETIGRIFDPFFTTKFTGRGLGLSAMLGIVRGHKAGLHVASVQGKGTTFTLLFPAGETTVLLPSPEPAPQPKVTGTVLVVDDEGLLRDLARMALEGAGFRVEEARDGAEAVEAVGRRPAAFDAVLLDMTMPRMGGAEAFQRIRALAPAMRVLLTSGYTQADSLESLEGLSPDGFLQKPFRMGELVEKMRELLVAPPRRGMPE
ncbi:CHASE domain-containing protein [Geothrix sp. 21YS21S-4]|uniref:CHASE domain-containing protein n=1 Tax=Geothrix sp. 21YS21S-4 TaxID=3068889 RepID=UPI0027B89658|nr:CHASE domain-containing protein [Geothrix sp. 21YS21S-4]